MFYFWQHPNPLLLPGDIPGLVSPCREFRECPRARRHWCFADIPVLELLPACSWVTFGPSRCQGWAGASEGSELLTQAGAGRGKSLH